MRILLRIWVKVSPHVVVHQIRIHVVIWILLILRIVMLFDRLRCLVGEYLLDYGANFFNFGTVADGLEEMVQTGVVVLDLDDAEYLVHQSLKVI